MRAAVLYIGEQHIDVEFDWTFPIGDVPRKGVLQNERKENHASNRRNCKEICG